MNVNDILHFLPSDDDDGEGAAAPGSTLSSNAAASASVSAVSSSESERLQPKEDRLSFIWASEKTGFNHLYLVTARIPLVSIMRAILL